MSTRDFGNVCERAVADYLVKKGYKISARNFVAYHGELDIVAENDEFIAFVEVKGRTDGYDRQKYGRPALAVNAEKKRHLISTAGAYLKQHPSEKRKRFDVAEVYFSEGNDYAAFEIKYYENAFTR